MCIRRLSLIPALVLAMATGVAAQGQSPFATPLLGKVIVSVREAGGARISSPVWIRLTSSDASLIQRAANGEDGSRIIFEDVPIGEYNVEVRAPGYLTATSEASLPMANVIAYVFVDMRLENGAAAPGSKGGPPVMAPKARKELDQAGQALRANNLKAAQDHLDLAKKLAPGHPDVHYLQGLIYLEQQNAVEARKSLETAVSLYPAHAGALASLGVALYRLGNFADAASSLDKAIELSPLTWQSHRALAMCQIRLHDYEKARAQAERALETAGNKAPELHVLLARILIAVKEREKARNELQSFIAGNPDSPEFPEAQRLLTSLLTEMNPPSTVKPEAGPGPSASSATTPAPSAAEPALFNAALDTAVPDTRTGPGRWAPPAVDDAPPVLLKSTTCKLPEVLTGAGKRATALAANLQQITATEKVEQSDLDEYGNSALARTNVFNYLVNILETRPGNLAVEEDRIPVVRSATPPRYVTNGLGALALIFHPYYASDYEMRCEGLTEVNGKPAWSVYFKQRADIPSRIRSYRIQAGSFNVALKGRAWIAANNFQVLRLETDLVEPVKELHLELEHLVIEYQPVDFKTRKVRLWLPANAEMYAFFRGHRFLHHHSFTDYKIFSVDVTQKIADTKP